MSNLNLVKILDAPKVSIHANAAEVHRDRPINGISHHERDGEVGRRDAVVASVGLPTRLVYRDGGYTPVETYADRTQRKARWDAAHAANETPNP